MAHSPAFLLITTRERWAKLSELHMWAFEEAKHMNRVSKGDKGVVYLTAGSGRFSAIGGLFTFLSQNRYKMRHPSSELDERWPFRVPIELDVVLENPLPIKPLLPDLEMFTDGPNWGAALQGRPVHRLPEADARTLMNLLYVAKAEEDQPLVG